MELPGPETKLAITKSSKLMVNAISHPANRDCDIKGNIIVKSAQDPRLQAEGKAGQSTEMGIIFVSNNDFKSEPGSEWIIGTCVKSPCVAAGNNELTSLYR